MYTVVVKVALINAIKYILAFLKAVERKILQNAMSLDDFYT